mmetsp:Transcript_15708/g.18930  ORF Transcript_15708/g.18930 Transcript_15708/m.18930 type:complete len:353 (-) Transcript_15708:700-1758(-)
MGLGTGLVGQQLTASGGELLLLDSELLLHHVLGLGNLATVMETATDVLTVSINLELGNTERVSGGKASFGSGEFDLGEIELGLDVASDDHLDTVGQVESLGGLGILVIEVLDGHGTVVVGLGGNIIHIGDHLVSDEVHLHGELELTLDVDGTVEVGNLGLADLLGGGHGSGVKGETGSFGGLVGVRVVEAATRVVLGASDTALALVGDNVVVLPLLVADNLPGHAKGRVELDEVVNKGVVAGLVQERNLLTEGLDDSDEGLAAVGVAGARLLEGVVHGEVRVSPAGLNLTVGKLPVGDGVEHTDKLVDSEKLTARGIELETSLNEKLSHGIGEGDRVSLHLDDTVPGNELHV